MQNAIEQRNEQKVTSQYWGFRELTAEELMLIGGGEGEDFDEVPEQETPLPPITAYASDSGPGDYNPPPAASTGVTETQCVAAFEAVGYAVGAAVSKKNSGGVAGAAVGHFVGSAVCGSIVGK